MNVDTLLVIEAILSQLPIGLVFFTGLCIIKRAVDIHKGT